MDKSQPPFATLQTDFREHVTVKPKGSGCEMTYDAQLTLKGVMRLIDPIFSLQFRRLRDNTAAGLRRELALLAPKK